MRMESVVYKNLKNNLVSTLTALALAAVPTVAFVTFDPGFAYAKNGNGGGNSGNAGGNNGNGNGNGNGGGNGKSAGASSKANAPASVSSKNVKAQLKGLNSLKRNINGLMNSSDPKMAPFKEFIVATANLQELEQVLQEASKTYADARAEFLALGIGSDPSAAKSGLESEISALADAEPAADDPAHATWEAEMAALESSLQTVDNLYSTWADLKEAETAVLDATPGTTDDDLTAAIIAAAQASGQAGFTADMITPELKEWISRQLYGAVSAYSSL